MTSRFCYPKVVPISNYPAATLKNVSFNQPDKKNRRRFSTLLIIVGIAVIASPFVTEIYGYFVKDRLNQEWAKQITEQKEEAITAAIDQADRLGDRTVASEEDILRKATGIVGDLDGDEFPLTKIKIPKIDLEQVVLSGVSPEVLKNGPGHYTGTALPGQRGNIGIAGHRVTYTHPFNRVDELDNGDKIILETIDNIYEYRVISKQQLEPNDLRALKPTKDARVTLTTCTPKYSARYRLDVQASLVKIVPTRQPSLVRRLVNRLAKPVPRKLPKSILDLALPRGQAGVANDPEDIDARLYLGMIYRNTGQYKEAAEQLNKAIELDETRPEPYYELSFVYEKNNQINKAISVLAKAIERAPEFEWAYYRLGTIYLDSGKIDKAVQVLKATLALNPLSADTHFFLGQAYEKQGEPELALAEYEESLEYVPDFLEAKAAIRRLAN